MRARLALVLVLVVAVVAMLGSGRPAEADPPPPFVVIVHPSNPNTTLSRKFLADAFLKKTTRWPNDDVIRPVDLAPDSSTRARFTEDVLKRSVAAVKSYWQQIIFSGRDVPPPELASEDEVLKFVSSNAGAVGYVSGTKTLTGVKPIGVD